MYIDAEQLKAHLLNQLNTGVHERKKLNPLTPEYAYTSGTMQAYAEMLDWLNSQPKFAQETTRTETHTKTREYYYGR